MKALSVDKLSFSYNKKESLLDNISFELEEGRILCILGPNGSGKTTLIHEILYPGKKNASKIELFGEKVCDIPYSDVSKSIGYVPQQIVPVNVSVIQTVVMGRTPYKKKLFSKFSPDDYIVAYDALEQMGIKHLAEKTLECLSGGEVQRVFIAQSIVKNAKLYVFDEPMAALDPEYQTEFLRLIKWLSENGKTVIFTTHNPNHLFALQDAEAALIDTNHKLHRFAAVSDELLTKTEEIYNYSMTVKFDENGRAFAVFDMKESGI
ncbi:MAG: ABC transporter ATP-binding protein [Ruminococcaceae bacterium]|nr:ABC transporter ATP-binding protein [Oscillospiraceae bacterium]